MKIKNWGKFQHFRDRNPPWIKLHKEILNQRDISVISDCHFRILIGLWLLASEDDEKEGKLPDIPDIAFRLRMEEGVIAEALQQLSEFLEDVDKKMISGRYQDDIRTISLARSQETETETETETDMQGGKKVAESGKTENKISPGGSVIGEEPPITQQQRPNCPYKKIVELYHATLPMCPKVVVITEARKKALRARWANGMHGMHNWEGYFQDVSKSKFLTGRIDPYPGRKQFVADFDFLIRESTIVKTQEGKYHERLPANGRRH